MKESFDKPSAIPPAETSEESVVNEQPDESISIPESVEAERYTIEDTPQERVEALEEGIRGIRYKSPVVKHQIYVVS